MKKILATATAVALSLAMVALPSVAAAADDTEPTDTATTVPTDAPTTEPESTEPVPTDPVSTDPVSTDPVSTDPVSTDPVSTEPPSTESESTEPTLIESLSTPRAESYVLTDSPVVKVDVCHWDQSGKWTPIEVSSAALGASGHIDPSTNDDHAFDIVEPFLDNPGKNYSATSYNVPEYKDEYPFNGLSGAEIMAAGCGTPEEEDIVIAVSGEPTDESCSEVEEGEVLPGSITITVTVDGLNVTLPNDHVTVEVKGPGDPAFTELSSNTLPGLDDGVYQFKVTVDEGYVLSTQKNFSETVGDKDPLDCVQLVDFPPVTPQVLFTAPSCTADGSLELISPAPSPEGPEQTVTWYVTVDGGVETETAAGKLPFEAGTSVVVRVVANGPFYVLEFDDLPDPVAERTFDPYEFTAPTTCDLNTLALTGSSDITPALALTAFLGLLGLAMVRSGIRVNRIRQEA